MEHSGLDSRSPMGEHPGVTALDLERWPTRCPACGVGGAHSCPLATDAAVVARFQREYAKVSPPQLPSEPVAPPGVGSEFAVVVLAPSAG